MALILHLISWVWLWLMVGLGLTRRSIKITNRYLILSRLGYLSLIITGVFLSTKTLGLAPELTLAKAVVGITTIGLVEMAFARWQESHLTLRLVSLLIIAAIVTLGFSLALHLISGWGYLKKHSGLALGATY